MILSPVRPLKCQVDLKLLRKDFCFEVHSCRILTRSIAKAGEGAEFSQAGRLDSFSCFVRYRTQKLMFPSMEKDYSTVSKKVETIGISNKTYFKNYVIGMYLIHSFFS